MKKETWLNIFTTIAYCCCFAVFIVWVSVIVAFALGYYSPKVVYAENISIDTTEFETDPNKKDANKVIINGYPVLRINGIYDSDNPNILIDPSFVVKGKSAPIKDEEGNIIGEEPITETKIKLSSSNPDVATVPMEGNLNEPIQITVTKDANGVNKGGFCYINVQNEQNQFIQKPLIVFVDIPVTELEVTSQDMLVENEENYIKFVLYEDEIGNISTKCLPFNSQDPSHLDTNSFFNSFRKSAKTIRYSIDENSSNNVIQLSQNGQITALNIGKVLVHATILKTYDDLYFVNNYEPEFPEQGDYIPPELMEGREVTITFMIEVRQAILEEIKIDNKEIQIPLFNTAEFTPQELGINFVVSNDNPDFINNLYDNLILETESKGLVISKNLDTKKWQFTLTQEPNQIVVNVRVQGYPEISAQILNIEVTQNDIKELSFEGTTKSSDNVNYNDLIQIKITKENNIINNPAEAIWAWMDNVNIISENGGNSTYSVVKIFAEGVYNNGSYVGDTYVNEQGQEIVQLSSTLFAGFGREIRGEDLLNPNIIQAIARGSIVLRAYVIKTDMNGNILDANGNIIKFNDQGNVIDENGNVLTENLPNLVAIASSKPVTFQVIERLNSLTAYAQLENGEEELIGSTSLPTNNILAVSSISKHRIRIEGNSIGALYDAYNNNTEFGQWLKIKNSNNEQELSIVDATITQDSSTPNVQVYYLNLDIHNNNPTKEYEELSITFEYYTGSTSATQGYESLYAVMLYIIEVPVESVEMNVLFNDGTQLVNAEPSDTITGIDCYWLKGLFNYTTTRIPNTNIDEVNSIKMQWGLLDTNNRLCELYFGTPKYTKGEIQCLKALDEKNIPYIIPKELEITVGSISYKILDMDNLDSNIAEIKTERYNEQVYYKLVIKEINTQFYVQITTNGKTDKICVSGSIIESEMNSLKWNMDNGDYVTDISKDLLTEGYNLSTNSLFGLKITNEGTTGQNVCISSNSQFIKFELLDDNISGFKIDNNVLTYEGSEQSNISANINVILETEDGLKIKQKYTINFVE